MRFFHFALACLLCIILTTSWAQERVPDKDLIFKAADDIIKRMPNCALITLDDMGQPQARTMDPFPPEEDFVIWFGTNRNSRKVIEIKNDPRVSIYYGEASGNGYVVLTGSAVLVDDSIAKEKYWKEKWSRFYPDRKATYLLIKVIPKTIEVVSYEHGLTGDTVSWRAPNIDFSVTKQQVH